MHRRKMLKMFGAVAVGSALPFVRKSWSQAGQPDWAARIGSLPRPGGSDIVLSAVGDLILNTPASARNPVDVQQMYRVLRESDVAFGNCEEAISTIGYLQPKAAVMGWPTVLDDHKAAGFDIMSIANNHYMDLGEEGALSGFEEFAKRGIPFAGAGRNRDEALSPGIIQAKSRRIGLVAFWCTPASSESAAYMQLARAAASKPGVAVITGAEVRMPSPSAASTLLLPDAADIKMLSDAVARAKTQVDFLMVSFHMHWGGGDRNGVNDGRKVICRAAVESGADLVIGHGPHVLNGVEIYRGKPILHSLGHFYFQMMQDGKAKQLFQNSPSVVRLVETGFNTPEHQRSAIARIILSGNRISRLDLVPLAVDVRKDGNPRLPSDAEAADTIASLREMSSAFGTEIRSRGWYAEVGVA